MRSNWKRSIWTLCLLASGCFRASAPPDPSGSESHFLSSCSEACGEGLSCVCGVCTRSCTAADSCSSLGAQAVCLASDGSGDTRSCAGVEQSASVCDERCVDATDCRSGFRCEAGLCRQPALSAPSGAAGAPGSTQNPPASNTGTPPLVMLLNDTSGSMERRTGCTCETLGCEECLPDCGAGEKSGWNVVLGALNGSYSDFACQRLDRTTENGATYDLDYPVPHFSLAPSARQRDDGLIARYATSVRFGSATFDARPTVGGRSDLVAESDVPGIADEMRGESGAFSYGMQDGSSPRLRPDGSAVGEVFYPTATARYMIDNGIQNASAGPGALFLSGVGAERTSSTSALHANLRGVRPYGGTPIAAALDDLYYYFRDDPQGAPARAADEQRYVILITDGAPDPDFRDYRCDCSTRQACSGDDPALMRCPYPLSVDAARHLRCSFDDASCAGPLDKLYVVAFGVDDASLASLDALAAVGGSVAARRAGDEAELRAQLTAIMNEIVASASAN